MGKKKIVLGTWAWGNDGDTFSSIGYSEKQLEQTFKEAINNDLFAFDTAHGYGFNGDIKKFGASERVLGKFIKRLKRENLYISDKFSPFYSGFDDISTPSKMLKKSLKNLGTNYVDIYWLHTPENMIENLKELVELYKKKKIKSIGISNCSKEQLERAQRFLEKYGNGLRISAVQNHFSLLNRYDEYTKLIDYCKEHNIEYWGYMVLEQGALTGKYSTQHPFDSNTTRGENFNQYLKKIDQLNNTISKIAKKHNTSISSIPIAWAINKGVIPIIGVTKSQQVIDAKASTDISLTREEINLIENVASEINIDLSSIIGFWEEERYDIGLYNKIVLDRKNEQEKVPEINENHYFTTDGEHKEEHVEQVKEEFTKEKTVEEHLEQGKNGESDEKQEKEEVQQKEKEAKAEEKTQIAPKNEPKIDSENSEIPIDNLKLKELISTYIHRLNLKDDSTYLDVKKALEDRLKSLQRTVNERRIGLKIAMQQKRYIQDKMSILEQLEASLRQAQIDLNEYNELINGLRKDENSNKTLEKGKSKGDKKEDLIKAIIGAQKEGDRLDKMIRLKRDGHTR